jgi:hypothetical protein
MAKHFEKLMFGGLHEKHAVQRGIWVPTQHLLWDQGKPRKTLIELAGPVTAALTAVKLSLDPNGELVSDQKNRLPRNDQ